MSVSHIKLCFHSSHLLHIVTFIVNRMFWFFLYVNHGSRVQPCSDINRFFHAIYIYISHLFLNCLLLGGREKGENVSEPVWQEGRKKMKVLLSQQHLFCVGSLLPVSRDVSPSPVVRIKQIIDHFLVINKRRLSADRKDITELCSWILLSRWSGHLWKTSFAHLSRLCKHKATLITKT